MTPAQEPRPAADRRIVIASSTSPRLGELAPWARDELRDNVVPAELRDQLVVEVRRWSSGRRSAAS
jgi:hypothetical protein